MRKFVLIGKQLGHSFSKVFFTEKFQQESISAVYENIEIPEIAEVRPVLASGSFAGLDVIYASRNPAGPKQFGYSDINQHMLNACKVIVNCTPVGTFPNVNESVPFPFEYLTEEHLVIDLIYNPAQTHFLAQSAEAGATILNGLSMLKEQANKAWEIWNL